MSWGYSTKKICDKCNGIYTVEVSTLEKAKKNYGKCPYCENRTQKLTNIIKK